MVCNTRSNLCIPFVIAGNFDEIITTSGLILFVLQLKLKRTERNKQFVMSESMKKRKRESTIIHGRPQKFFQGGTSTFCLSFSNCWRSVFPLSYLALFCFLVVSRARVHFCCAPLIVWLALIVCDVALVLCASSFVQKSLFGGQRSCCFIQCMSLDRSLRTRRISLTKPSLGHIM